MQELLEHDSFNPFPDSSPPGSQHPAPVGQRARLEENKALLPPLEKELALNRHRLAVLAGKFPSEDITLPEFVMSDFVLPSKLPMVVPSELVKNRPDIMASEGLLHAACAKIGVATADMYPSISLSADYGSQTSILKNLFESKKDFWSLGYGVVEPIIDGGARAAKRRGAKAVYEQALAQYKEVVLAAFLNVADTLRAIAADSAILNAQESVRASTQESLELTRNQFDAGAVNYDLVLSVERQYQQALIGKIQAQSARFYDSVALFQALSAGEDLL